MENRTKNDIVKEVETHISKFIGTKLNKDQIRNTMLNVLKYLSSKKCIKEDNYNVGDIKILWCTWNVKQKIVWFFMNKLKFGEKQMKWYSNKYLELFEQVERNDIEYQEYDLFKNQYKKYWFESNPKSVILIDTYFSSVISLTTVKLDTTIKV